MAKKFVQGEYFPLNPEKYIGAGRIIYRSSWELTMMKFLDHHTSVRYWASESIKIPYRNPFTGKQTVYVPDFFIVYADADGKEHAELIEVKPENQSVMESARKSRRNLAHYALNQSKWAAANSYCKKKGIKFRVITQHDIYAGTTSRRK